MRKFYLELDGVRVDLNRANGIMLVSPSGLGVTFDNAFADFENGFATKIHDKQSKGQIVAELCFLSSAYSKYKAFVDSLFTAKQIVFVYDPEGSGTEYKAIAEVNYVQKTESYGGVYMRCPIAFDLKSLWFTETTLTGTGSISVPSGGQIGAGVSVDITGVALSNPVITLKDSSNNVFAKVETFDLSVISTDLLNYSNFYDDSHFIGTVSGVPQDLSKHVSSFDVYGHHLGAFTIVVTDDDSASPLLSAVVRKYWRTV